MHCSTICSKEHFAPADMDWLQWMLPSLHIHELVHLFTSLKVNAPVPVYEQFKQISYQTINQKRCCALCELAGVD